MDTASLELAARVLFWFTYALYIGATVLYAYQFLLRRQQVNWWARFLTGAGFLCHTLSIGAHSMATDGTKFSGGNQLVLAAWAVILVYLVIEHVLRIRVYGAFLVPVAVVMLTLAQFMGWEGNVPLPAETEALINTTGIAFHVALIVFANAGFAFGAVSAGLYLYQDSQLRRHKSSRVGRRLPSLATLQTVARRSITLAFPIYTAGLLLGMVRAIQVDVEGWWADPRIMMSGLVWFTFGLYLVLLYRHDVSTRTASKVALVGFVFVVIVAIIARTVPVGFHVFGIAS